MQRKDTIRTTVDLESHARLSREKNKENKKFLKKLKKTSTKSLDKEIHSAHTAVFSYTDCLSCANCCKTTGPLFTPKDVQRISKHLKIKASTFEEKFLDRDIDGDLVLQTLPCHFLQEDNACSIYEIRPKACREFPHTDRNKQKQILNLTEKNIAVCPAVYDIVERIKLSALNK